MGKFLRRAFDFSGISNRQEFWVTLFGLTSVYIFLITLFGIIPFLSLSLDIKIISAILFLFSRALGNLVPILLMVAITALFLRRLRDAGISKIVFLGLFLISPIVSLSLLMTFPNEVIENIKIYGRANIPLASGLLILFIFGLAFIVAGLFPSKRPN